MLQTETAVPVSPASTTCRAEKAANGTLMHITVMMTPIECSQIHSLICGCFQRLVFRCNCNPTGSTNGQCDIVSGQCECQPGVTGQRCERCEVNFFGFSSSGCKRKRLYFIFMSSTVIRYESLTLIAPLCLLTACDCDPEGSRAAQCTDDGQCECRPGFVGIRCDMCEENYFYNRSISGCQQCPHCYSLVRDKVRAV